MFDSTAIFYNMLVTENGTFIRKSQRFQFPVVDPCKVDIIWWYLILCCHEHEILVPQRG